MTGKFTTNKASALRRLCHGCLLLATACFFSGVAWAQSTPPPVLIPGPQVYSGGVNAIYSIPNAVAMGDFNGDGLLDFAVVEYAPPLSGSSQVQIFLGNQDGSFTAGNIYTIGTISGQPYATNHTIAVGHFNGPTQPLGFAVAVNQAVGCPSGGVVFYFGFGDGTFQAPTCLANASAITSLAVADFNNDGFDDIAVSNASGAAAGTITVYLNHALINTGAVTNSFYNYASRSAVLPGNGGATLYGTIVAGNINGQNGTSLALLASTGPFTQYVSVFENAMVEQNGGFFLDFIPPQLQLAAPPNGFLDIALADFTGTGIAALVGIGTQGLEYSVVTMQTGVGNPQLGAFKLVPTGPIGLALAVADFDGNGVPDFAFLGGNQELSISLNPGSATGSGIGPFGPAGQGIAAGFSAGLGKWVVVDSGVLVKLNPVFAQLDETRSVAVYLIDPKTGQPALAPLYKQSPGFSAVANNGLPAFAVADFNGVGVPDVAVLGGDPNFSSGLYATVSIFQNAYQTATPGYATPPTIVDLANLLGVGLGSFGPGAQGYALVAGSFRAFNPDIALVTSEGITLLENQGASAQGPFNFTLAPNCQGFFGSLPNNCYLGGDSHYPGLSNNGPRPPIIAVDANGDGYQDVVVAYPENCYSSPKSAIYVFFSNGDGTFQPPVYIPSPVVNPVGLAAGKLLGHATPDLVVVNGGEMCSGTQAVTGPQTLVGAAIIPTNGDPPGTIFSQASDIVSPSVSAVAVADMNGDGYPDVVISASDGIHVLLNALGTFPDQGAVPLYGIPDIITNTAQIDIADLNKDGNLDVAAAIGGIVYIFPGDGKGGLSTPVQAFASGPDSNQIRTIDVTGNGTADVLVNNSLGFSVLLNGSTVGSANPFAEFVEVPVSFDSVAQGGTESLLFILENLGGVPLTLGAVAYANNTGNQFSAPQVQCGNTTNPAFPITIASQYGCAFTITFAPTAIGPASAQLIFSDNASLSNVASVPAGVGNFQQSISLSGTVTAGQANVSINITTSPAVVALGSGDLTYTVKLTNAGPNAATDLFFYHQLEGSVMLHNLTSSGAEPCTGQHGTLGVLASCYIGTLPVGSTATIILDVAPTVATILKDAFVITEDETDANPESVQANVTVLTSLTVIIPTVTEMINITDAPAVAARLLSTQVSVSSSPLSHPHGSTTFNYTLTVKNLSGITLSGPFQIVLSNLAPGVVLTNTTGSFNGSPYITVPSITSLAPGQMAMVTIMLNKTSTATFDVYSGTF
jgi:uncharacterized repeat protein (TIGR01451 family)